MDSGRGLWYVIRGDRLVDCQGFGANGSIEMFRKVDHDLGEKIKEATETKIENDHEHPHKSAWH